MARFPGLSRSIIRWRQVLVGTCRTRSPLTWRSRQICPLFCRRLPRNGANPMISIRQARGLGWQPGSKRFFPRLKRVTTVASPTRRFLNSKPMRARASDTPINLDVGASVQGTKTNQLVVAIAPHAGPQKVIIVGDTTHRAGVASHVTTVTSGTSAAKTFSNPNLNILLQRQAPLRLLPGQTIR